MLEMKDYISLNNIDFSYGHSPDRVQVLRNLSLKIEFGKFVTIIGPSGCGKTTLLKLMGGLLEPHKGTIQVGGVTAEIARKRKYFGFVFQEPSLLPWRSVIENIRLPQEIVKNNIHLQASYLLNLTNLSRFKDTYPHQLSGGMKQKVAIARALSFNPEVLLMDEPFKSLDEISRELLNVELLTICGKTKKTVVFVTHDLVEAVFLADKVIVLTEPPATVKKIIEVPLQKPRKISMKNELPFNNIVKTLRKHLKG